MPYFSRRLEKDGKWRKLIKCQKYKRKQTVDWAKLISQHMISNDWQIYSLFALVALLGLRNEIMHHMEMQENKDCIYSHVIVYVSDMR